MFPLSLVTCNMSHVTCHMPCVTFQKFCYFSFFFRQSGHAIWWRVSYHRGLPCPVIYCLFCSLYVECYNMKGKYGRPCQFITGKNMSIGNMQPYQSLWGKVGYQILNLHIENMHKLLKIIYHDYLVTESIDNFIKQNYIGQK